MNRSEIVELGSEVAMLHAKLMAAGFLKTGQAMHSVVQAVGYEAEEKLTLKEG